MYSLPLPLAVIISATLATLLAPSISAQQTASRSEYNASSYSSSSCQPHNGKNASSSSAGVIPLSALPTTFPNPTGPQDPVDYIQIRNTAMLYPLAIDGKNFGSLSNVFAPDVVANLSQGPVITGLPALEGALAGSVAKVNSHHNLGTQFISVEEGACSAESVTYFHASLIGVGASYGQIVYALGQYQDSWIKLSVGWRIASRNLVYMAPFIGNVSIVE